MKERIAEASPHPRASIIGVVYLVYFLTTICAELFIRGLVVSDVVSCSRGVAPWRTNLCFGCTSPSPS